MPRTRVAMPRPLPYAFVPSPSHPPSQQQGSEGSARDAPRQAWPQQPLHDYEQQQGRKVWMDSDPYGRPQPDDIRRAQPQGGYMTHEQKFELMQRGGGAGAPLRSSAPAPPQQLHQSADGGSQFRSNPWNRPQDAAMQQQQHHDGFSAASDPDLSGGEGIAVGDDYTRAQQAPSGVQMLFNHRTGRFEPTQPPPKEAAPRFQQQPPPANRGWGVTSKARPATAEAAAPAAPSSRSILKAPAVATARIAPDAKSLRDEARYTSRAFSAAVRCPFWVLTHSLQRGSRAAAAAVRPVR